MITGDDCRIVGDGSLNTGDGPRIAFNDPRIGIIVSPNSGKNLMSCYKYYYVEIVGVLNLACK